MSDAYRFSDACFNDSSAHSGCDVNFISYFNCLDIEIGIEIDIDMEIGTETYVSVDINHQ